jgi:hypothetical protein
MMNPMNKIPSGIKIGTILLVTALVMAPTCVQSSYQFDDDVSYEEHDFSQQGFFMEPSDAQDASSPEHSEGPKVSLSADGSKPAPAGCGVYTMGNTYSHKHYVNIDLAEYTDPQEDKYNFSQDDADSTIGLNTLLSIKPLSASLFEAETSELFELKVTEVVPDEETLASDADSKVKLTTMLMDADPSEAQADNLLLTEKFARSFYYRMDCNGGLLEVKASQDDSDLLIDIKKKMLTSFYFQTAQPAESANEKEDERTELDDEMWNSLQQDDDQEWATDPAEEILSTDALLVKNEHEIWGDEEEALNDHEEADVPMEARDTEDVQVEVPEAKQPEQPKSTSPCQKGADDMFADKVQGKPSGQGTKKCLAPAPKLANKVNQTCSSVLVARPRS